MSNNTRTERQKLCLKRWVESNCKASIVASTGFGKTRMAMMAIELLLRHKTDAYIIISVPTQYLKNQWIEELTKYGFLDNCDVIVTNTIIKHQYTCDLLVIDECHRVAATVFASIFVSVKYSMILCLTATIERLDGKESIIKQHAPVCDTITLEEATKNGWVSPVKNYLVLLDVDLTEYKELDRKFNSYFSFFDWNFNIAMGQTAPMFT